MADVVPSDAPKPKRPHNPKTPTTQGRAFTKLKLPDGLTVQEEAYARARAYGMTQHAAMELISGGQTTARGAGSHYEKKPHVKARINTLRNEITQRAVEKAAVDRAWVLTRLMKVTDRCMQAEPVLDRKGAPTGEYKFDSAGANRSLELLGKELGMFGEKRPSRDNPLEEMSEEDLLNLAADLLKQTGVTDAIDIEARVLTSEPAHGPQRDA